MEKIFMTKNEFKYIMEVISKADRRDYLPILKGICFKANEVVALDSYRLCIRKLNTTLKGEYIINYADIKQVSKISNRNIKYVEINFYEDKAIIKLLSDASTVINKFTYELMKGSFVNYSSLISNRSNDKIIINEGKKLADTIKGLRKNQTIAIEYIDNNLSVYKADYSTDNNRWELCLIDIIETSTKANKSVLIGFNASYLREAIKYYDDIVIRYINSTCQVSFESMIDEKKFDLVLPVRLVGVMKKI